MVEAAAELLGHVPDVGGEIGRLAVRAEDDPILVIAEIGRAEPDRTVLLVDVAAFAQPLDRPRDPAFIVQARLARPDVEPDTEAGQARLDALADATGGPVSELAVRVCVGQRRGQPHVVGHRRRQLVDVVAVVAIVGHGVATPEGRHRRAEVPDLRARIVEVVLAGDLLTTGLEDAAEHVADECPARVPDVQRSGRVGRHEFDVDRAGRPGDDPAPLGGVGEDRRDGRFEGAVAKPQVEEAGRCDLGGGDRCAGGIVVCLRGDLSGEGRADGEWRHPVRASELHREVAREVPVCRVGWSLDLDGGSGGIVGPGGKRTGRDGPIPRAPDRRADVRTKGRGCLESGRIRVGHVWPRAVGP